MVHRLSSFLLIFTVLIFSNSCVWRPGSQKAPTPPLSAGINHRVQSGETLWSIAHKYGVKPEVIRQNNSIRNITDIKVGTTLFIPGGTPPQEASGITLPAAQAPYRNWQYIIVHHSATDIGCAERFDKQHRDKGWRGIGYNFVINNGSCGHPDGEIEITARWTRQQTGAHCKASDMNENGIGICLVGNFSKSNPTEKQLLSLINLIRHLQQEFNIPASRVKGHGTVRGANTECPGNDFPWPTVKKYLL